MKFPAITGKKAVLILAALAALGAAGLGIARLTTPPKTSYITANVTRSDLEESVLASGALKAFKTVTVGAQVNGQLKKLHFALGDRVKKGDLLAEIDPSVPQYNLQDAEAQVENLRAQKRSKQALLGQYELAAHRQERMSARDAASRSDLESARAQLESTRHDISSLDAQIRRAIIAVDTARVNLGYTRIYAPIDGTVISIDTEEGQTVISNQSATTILTLATLDTMTVKAKISEADVVKVTPGLPVYFTLLGDSETRYNGTLRAIEPGPVSSGTGSSSSSSSAVYYYGLFEVPNPGNRLRVSMTAQVTIVLNRVKQALCIPVTALGEKRPDGRVSVKVLAGDHAEIRTVRTGISDNVQMQVLEGVREGDKVIVGDSSTLPGSETEALTHPPPGGRR